MPLSEIWHFSYFPVCAIMKQTHKERNHLMAVRHMTEGSVFPHLLSYSVPLILGNLLQLTYNAADSVIAGRFIGKDALAAVGTSSPVMNILILGISGICIGASVIMSEFFGAGEEALLKKELSTTLLFGLFFSLVLAGAGALLAEPLLLALSVPEDILGISAVYLRIIFFGTPFTYFYNAYSSALKSIGDSTAALKFLAFSSVLNLGLDVVFIGFLGFGIACSAMTTVFAEAVSAFLCIWYVRRKIPLLCLTPRSLCIDRGLLAKTLRYGGITALQQSCQPVGKLLIQGAVNPLGVDAIAAFNAVSRIDDFAFTPEQSIASGITTFVAQNRGAGKPRRIGRGFLCGLALEAGYWLFICTAVLLLRYPAMMLFVSESEPEIIELGCRYLETMAFFYLLPAFTNGFQGFYRGIGKMGVTLAGTFIQTSLRVVFVYLLTPSMGLLGTAWACAVGWIVMLLYEVPLFFRVSARERGKA